MTAKSKAPKSKAKKVLSDLPEFVASCAARLSGQSPSLGNLQSLFHMFTVEFGHHESLESKTIYAENGSTRHVEKTWWWKLPGKQSLSLHYGPAGIQVLHGFAENPDTNAVLLHLTKADKKKKANPRLLTPQLFTNILNGAIDSDYALLPPPGQQYRLLEDTLILLLGKPVGDGGTSCGTEYVEWGVGNADLTLSKTKEGITLKLRDLSNLI